MKQIIFMALLIPFISGCTSIRAFICGEPEQEIIYVDRVVEVKVPVPAQCPAPKELSELKLPINNIDESYRDKPNEVGAAYIKSIRMLKDRVEEQDTLLDVYRNQDGKDQVR